MSDGLALRYAKILLPFAVAVAAALVNPGCSDGTETNTGDGGAGGSDASSSSSSSSSSSGTSGSSSSSSSSSSSGMMSCGDMQTDTMNCGKCGNQCAPGQICTTGVCVCGVGTASFAGVQAIFTAKCATTGCHTGATPKSGLDLSAGNSYAELVNVASSQCGAGRMRVLPSKPSDSYLIDKVMGVDLCGALAKRMPPSGPLSTMEIQTISNWICAGAPTD